MEPHPHAQPPSPTPAAVRQPDDENQRLQILQELGLRNGAVEPGLAALTRIARQDTGCEVALITLIDRRDALHLACDGAELTCTPREQSFCTHAILAPGFCEVPDLRIDPRFAANPLVAIDDGWRHYAAAPLLLDGCVLGTLCVLDRQAGLLGPQARQRLEDLAAIITDGLHQRRQYRAIEDHAARLRDLVRASGDWAWELDEHLRCQWLAGDFQAVTGQDPAQAIGQLIEAEPLVDASGHDLSPPRTVHDLLRAQGAFSRVLSRRRTARGTIVISRSAVPMFDDQGRFRGHRGSAREVTARIEREGLLREKTAAESANRAKSEFLSRVSHELRTPLNAILGFTQLMALDQEHPLAAPQRHRLEGVRRAGQHLLDMINDVLDIAQLEQGMLPLNPRTMDLGQRVRECLATVQPLATRQAIALNTTVPDGLQVVADARALEQVLLNLLSNAIKYNTARGRVDVAAAIEGTRAVVTVTDTGDGLRPDELAQLFQPFNRLGAERRRIEGSGLGLVIVRQLMRAMGGDVAVGSEPGQGTRVQLDLPLAPAEAGVHRDEAAPPAAGQPAPVKAPAPPATPRQVLYVEDEPLNVLLMQEIFKARPAWTLHVACTGAEGLAAAQQWQPDLALIDMNLPDINGLELLRRLRALPQTRALRCIALSADAMTDQIAAARAAGFEDYWTKPIDLTHLLDALGQALEARPQT